MQRDGKLKLFAVPLFFALTGAPYGCDTSCLSNGGRRPCLLVSAGPLREDIINGIYYSDSILTELEISKKFGGSKTPAREALGALCAEGLLERLPNKGYLIKRYSLQELDALLEFRSILENAIIELAIKRATDQEIQKLEAFCDDIDALDDEELSNQCVLLNREFEKK